MRCNERGVARNQFGGQHEKTCVGRDNRDSGVRAERWIGGAIDIADNTIHAFIFTERIESNHGCRLHSARRQFGHNRGRDWDDWHHRWSGDNNGIELHPRERVDVVRLVGGVRCSGQHGRIDSRLDRDQSDDRHLRRRRDQPRGLVLDGQHLSPRRRRLEAEPACRSQGRNQRHARQRSVQRLGCGFDGGQHGWFDCWIDGDWIDRRGVVFDEQQRAEAEGGLGADDLRQLQQLAG